MAAGSRTSARSKRRLKIWMPRTKTFSDVSSKAKSRGSRALSVNATIAKATKRTAPSKCWTALCSFRSWER